MTDPAAVMPLAPVIPMLVVEDATHARPVAEALAAGGIRALEVTLHTGAAVEAICEMAGVGGRGARMKVGTAAPRLGSGSTFAREGRMTDAPQIPEVQHPAAGDDEPFDVQAARHTAFIHAIAQIALVSSCETLRVLQRRNLVDATDLAPIHETISLLRDALAPAFLAADREMFEHAVAPFPK